MASSPAIRLGVDIGGTFTDVALEAGDRRYTAKGLTTARAPEAGVLAIVRAIIAEAGIKPGDVQLIIHGTTLATNALIERKGAKTALLTTEGFRDVLEIRHENRFEQYDVNIDLPPPLVPRRLRLPVRERIDAQGNVLVPLDEASVTRALDQIAAQNIEAVAVGFLHSFTNPDHEHRVGEAIARRLPRVAVSLSSDVSPEMREYERFSTACANAYLQPLIGSYLGKLARELEQAGFRCPMLLMTSGGGITTTETAIRFPVINDVYAKQSQQGRNVVVGPLVYSLALGMSVSDVSGKAIANLATEELKHPAPVFHGDTLFCESEVLEVRPSQSKPDRGTVKVHTRVLNQDGLLVAEFKRVVLVPRRDREDGSGGAQPAESNVE